MEGGSRFDLLPDFAKEHCYEHDGVIIGKAVPKCSLEEMKDFEVRPDDVFIIVYPKSGTTWMQQIVTMVQAGGEVEAVSKKHVLARMPFLEMTSKLDFDKMTKKSDQEETWRPRAMYEVANKMASPRVMKTQLPPQFLPKQLQEKNAKVICVARNPKDVAVSYFHFCHYSPGLPPYPTWDQFFKDFCANLLPKGSWFDHVLHWWNRRHQPNVFFITYEEMKRDLRGAVVRVSDFLGKNLSDDVIDKITKHCTFDAMKKDPKANPDSVPVFAKAVSKKKSFMRKGEIGDWKNHFTVAQNEEFDELCRTKLSATGLKFIYEL
ncbi:sulfotransferase 1C2-like [Diadema antillarum]|uniref:sulfotransferase 1C2-like n=1 Tax=Diadema antillarum TaxID=105358 RepID=UPI003A86D4E0